MDFSKIASDYRGTVQIPAGEKLLLLLDIKKHEDVLDLGCGNGKLTARIRCITKGRVVGIDASWKMIEIAKRYQGIEFYVMRAEDMNFYEEFDVIFCNSAFQWFKPHLVLPKCYKALRKGGRIGIQAPAKKVYCPNFVEAFKQVQEKIHAFRSFKNPWFFLEGERDYKELFESYGFEVSYCKIETVKTYHTPQEVFDIFMSGASVGYLNPKYYDKDISNFVNDFKAIVRCCFEEQAKDGLVELVFNRVYLVAHKS